MNELDLTPFKVEFDREINRDDIECGDFVLFEDYRMSTKALFAQFIQKNNLNAHLVLYGSENHKVYFRKLPVTILDMPILAIYRINKFKY